MNETDFSRFRYRLITLWDLMRPFRAAAFLNLLELLHILRAHQQATDINSKLDSLTLATLPAADRHKELSELKQQREDFDNLGEVRRPGLESFIEMESDCIALELVASLATVRKFKTIISRPNSQYSEIYPLAEELQGRLVDEMESKCFWALTTREREYYERPRNGWDETIARFADLVTDVEEASKCFALSRYPAAVFHSVQIVEIGLIELGKFINVSDPQSGWTAVSGALTKIIKTDYKMLGEFEKMNRPFLEQVQGTVDGLKNAWRNKISHAHGKLILMTKDFSPDVAEEILFATRAFMRRLADGLPAKAESSGSSPAES